MRGFFAVFILSFFLCSSAYAQSFSGVEIGQQENTVIAKLGRPYTRVSDARGYQYSKYRLPDGNTLSITTNKDGAVIFMERDWESGRANQKAGFGSFIFGKTTMMDVLIALGHSGRVHNDNFAMQTMPNGDMAFSMPYDLEKNGQIAIFMFLIKENDFLSIASSSPENLSSQISKTAKLDSILVSTAPILLEFWSQEFIGTSGTPIKWQMPN